jgi:isopentenyl diphosphate isomerase/L-lactate dehydrogenase-like FMN-dependent dehydrogenase
MSPHHMHTVSRRRLLQFLAASPLFARSALALAILRAETRNAMQQLGAPSVKDLTPAMVRRV